MIKTQSHFSINDLFFVHRIYFILIWLTVLTSSYVLHNSSY